MEAELDEIIVEPAAVAANTMILSDLTAPEMNEDGSYNISAYVSGEFKVVPVDVFHDVLNQDKTAVSEKYVDKLCIYTVSEEGVYYPRLLSDSYDEQGSYNGLETDRIYGLWGKVENSMFLAEDAQIVSNVQRISLVDNVNMYIGSRENVDDVNMTEFSKVIVRTYFTISKTYEWVTYDTDAMKYSSLSNSYLSDNGFSIPTETVSYIVSNNVNSYDTENLVVLFITNTYCDDSSDSKDAFSSSDLKNSSVAVRNANVSFVDGNLVMKTTGTDVSVALNNLNVDTSLYRKIRIRMKAEYANSDVNEIKSQIFFLREIDSGYSESVSRIVSSDKIKGIDGEGWMILDIDLSGFAKWNGIVKNIRFDPADLHGTYTIDYIRFIKNGDYISMTDEQLEAAYTPTRLLADEAFENGFDVRPIINNYNEIGHFEYTGSGDDSNNVWAICPWWTHNGDGLSPKYATNCIWKNRDTTTDEYTIADNKGTTRVTLNPEDRSVSMTLNCTKIYNGTPHIKDDPATPDVDESNRTWWPHLLLEQDPTIYEVDKTVNTAAADRVICELDVRMPHYYKDTSVTEGFTANQYLVYFYLFSDKLPNKRIWFGLCLFDDRGGVIDNTTWSPDSAANQMIYCIPQETVFQGIGNSFIDVVRSGNTTNIIPKPSNDWKTVRVDLTPHIDRAIEWANRDNVFNKVVTKEDFYFGGVNIGFEVHGNIDCTFEIRNFNIVSYSE